jgi:hypothetical protein
VSRSAFATACGFVSVLASSGAALAEPPCAGIVITDVVENEAGERTSLGEWCYEQRPGFPIYYDAPSRRFRIGPESLRPVAKSVTHFESTRLEALGVVNLGDLTNPFPAGQGRADFSPE